MSRRSLVLAALVVSSAVTMSACSGGSSSPAAGSTSASGATTSASSSATPTDIPSGGISASEGSASVSVGKDSSGSESPATLSAAAGAPAACRKVVGDLSALEPYLSANQPLTGGRADKAHQAAAALRTDAAAGSAQLSAAAKNLAGLVDSLVLDVRTHNTKAALGIVTGGALERSATQIGQLCRVKR